MKQEAIPEIPDLPESHRWTLWTFYAGTWSFEAMHRRERLEELRINFSGRTSLILPPGETPLMARERCHGVWPETKSE
jgi:hypothetical protein